MKKLATHNQGFHADDVMAYAILKEVLTKRGETWTMVRTRDQAVIDDADIAFDIGNSYNPAMDRYDHHQKDRAGARPNGILYASAGLIWNHFGRELCSNESVWQSIDRSLISEIDAIDSGQNYVGELLFKDTGYSSMGMHIANFEPGMFETKTPEILMQSFEEASEFARGILRRMISSTESLEQAFQEASKVYEASSDKQVIVFEKNYERPTWKRMAQFPEPVYIVYPNSASSQWKVECVPKGPTTMESRKLFPEFWRGLRDEEFARTSGANDGEFCHPSGFLLGTGSRKTAIELAKKSLLM